MAASWEWPPNLEALKEDLGIEPDDDRDDATLSVQLDAAIAHVRSGPHRRRFDFGDTPDPAGVLPRPDHDMVLGTVRLAGRWHSRRRSPDGLVSMGEIGSSRVPSFDPDIERLLRVGRYAKSVLA